MVCCAFLAAILGLFTLVWRPFFPHRSPMAWRSFQQAHTVARFSLTARLRSFSYALTGLVYVVTIEANMRVHLVAAILAIMLGIILKINVEEWRWIGLAIALVLVAETFNTAIEQACNAHGGGHNESIRIAKDVAAGAVLLCACLALGIGLSIYAPAIAVRTIDMANFSMCVSSTAR
jgi:diacylglycerol kinase (ATP)